MSSSGTDPQTPEPREPSNKPAGVFKIVLGLAFAAATVYLVTLHAGQTWNEPSAGAGAVSGIAAGLALWLLLAGTAQVMGKRVALPAGIALVLICAVAGGVVEPRALQARRVQIEQAAWERLAASSKTYDDYQVYEHSAPAPRRGYVPGMALAQVREEVARQQGTSTGRVETLRRFIADYRGKADHEEPGAMQPAIDLARAELARAYASGLEGLALRVERDRVKEVEEDPQMRSAFRAVLERLAQADDDHVYLVFTSDNKVAADASQSAASDTRMLDSGEAFSPEREDKRRIAFIKAMEHSFELGFAEPLVRLRTLDEGTSRQGKVIFEVHCATRRAPGGFQLTINDTPIGTLFNLDVGWKFLIFDIDGKQLAAHQSHSNPAEKLRFELSKGDPSWAAYSVMMDSAYYNYCRQIAARLGLVQPVVKEVFDFER